MFGIEGLVKGAFFSVADKDGTADFAGQLAELGFEIFGSPGSIKYLRERGIKGMDITELRTRSFKKVFADLVELADKAGIDLEERLAKFHGPILDHQVVSLVPEVHACLLARRDVHDHLELLVERDLPFIDVVRADFYALEAAIHKALSTWAGVKEATDIGGPTMVRSSAKRNRYIIVDRNDERAVLDCLRNQEIRGGELRDWLAAKAEAYVARYCLSSATYLSHRQIQGIIFDQLYWQR